MDASSSISTSATSSAKSIRGVLLASRKRAYNRAIEDFDKVLALQPLTATGAASHNAARFVAGGHSSLLAPDENFDPTGDVTTEMQTQFGSFFASDGALVEVTDASLLKHWLATAA